MTVEADGLPVKECGQVQFGGTPIFYVVVRSARRKKTVSLRLSAAGLEVYVPARMDPARVQAVVFQKAAWVVSKQRRVREAEHTPPPRRLVDGETLLYLGRQYRLKRALDTAGVKLSGRFIVVPDRPAPEVRATLVAWYRERAAERLAERVGVYSRKLGRGPLRVLVRDQKKRWGSCNSKGELRFNWRVVMAPPALLDYVVAHELCHLEHLNHSPKFWRRLGQLLPDYARLQAELDRQGSRYALETDEP